LGEPQRKEWETPKGVGQKIKKEVPGSISSYLLLQENPPNPLLSGKNKQVAKSVPVSSFRGKHREAAIKHIACFHS